MNSFLLAPEPEPEQFFLFLTEAGAVPKLAGSEILVVTNLRKETRPRGGYRGGLQACPIQS